MTPPPLRHRGIGTDREGSRLLPGCRGATDLDLIRCLTFSAFPSSANAPADDMEQGVAAHGNIRRRDSRCWLSAKSKAQLNRSPSKRQCDLTASNFLHVETQSWLTSSDSTSAVRFRCLRQNVGFCRRRYKGLPGHFDVRQAVHSLDTTALRGVETRSVKKRPPVFQIVNRLCRTVNEFR